MQAAPLAALAVAAHAQTQRQDYRHWPPFSSTPVACVVDDKLERMITKYEVPAAFGKYMDEKGMRQVGHLAQIASADKLHALLTSKVNASCEPPLQGDDLEFLQLRVEAMWKAAQKYFDTNEAQSNLSDACTSRSVGSSERSAKIKAYEIRNNAVLSQHLQPSKSVWETLAANKDNNDFVYIPVEKIASAYEEGARQKVRGRDPDGTDREKEAPKEDMPAWPFQVVKKLRLLAVAADLEWGVAPDTENKNARRIHDAIQRYADHAADRTFKQPRPTLTQLLAADKACRKGWEYIVSRG